MHQNIHVLLIGGGGTLGLYTAHELLNLGYCVDIICKNDPDIKHERLTIMRLTADFDSLLELVSHKHYAGIVNFLHYNDVQSYKPIHQLLSCNTEHLVFLSSYRVYADTNEPITEQTPKLLHTSTDTVFLEDKSYYALVKTAAEDYIRQESRTTNWTVVRPVISFSANRLDIVTRSGQSVLQCARENKPFELPMEARHLTAGLDWAGNSGKLIANLLLKEQAYGQAYTISSAQNLTWGQVADIYEELLGVQIRWIGTGEYMEKYNTKDPYILLYDRLFERRIDNSKVLAATGLTEKDFTPIRKAIQFELNKLGWRRNHA